MRKLFVTSFAAVLLLNTVYAASDSEKVAAETNGKTVSAPTRNLLIFGHRGHHSAPENTIIGYKRALDEGADGLETDVTLTKDKVIVMHHDRNAKRLTGYDCRIDAKTLAEWRAIKFKYKKAGYGDVPMATLSETLDMLPADKKIILDFKENNPELMLAVKNMLLEKKTDLSKVRIMAFDRAILIRAKEMIPDATRLWAITLKNVNGKGKLNTRLTDKPPKDLAQLVLKMLKKMDCHEINVNGNPSVVDEEFIRTMHDAGVKVYIWVIDDPDMAARYVKMQCDGFVSGQPAAIRSVFPKEDIKP